MIWRTKYGFSETKSALKALTSANASKDVPNPYSALRSLTLAMHTDPTQPAKFYVPKADRQYSLSTYNLLRVVV